MISSSSMGRRSKGRVPRLPDEFQKTTLIYFITPTTYLFSLPFRRRSLSELEGICAGTDSGEKVKQVTERATMFKIASDAMINVSERVKY